MENPSINDMIEVTNTMDSDLIRDAANPLSRQARQGADMLDKMYKS